MIIEHLSIAVEQICCEFVWTENLFMLFGPLLLQSLPFNIVSPFDGVTYVFDGLEKISNHSRLDVSLKLAGLGFDFSIRLAISSGLFLRIGLLFV